jgi:hypothetical protein
MILESEISKSLDCFWKTIDWVVNDPIYFSMHFLRLQIDLWAEICLHGREAVSILLPMVCKKCETYLLNCKQRLSQHPMSTWRITNDSQFCTVCSPTIVSSPPSIDVGHEIVRSRLTAIARGHRVQAAQGWGQQLEDVQVRVGWELSIPSDVPFTNLHFRKSHISIVLSIGPAFDQSCSTTDGEQDLTIPWK